MFETKASFLISSGELKDIKDEVDRRRLNFPKSLPNIFYKVEHLNKQQQVQATMQENSQYKIMKSIGRYLKTKGFGTLVEFVRHHIISTKEYEFYYTTEALIQEENDSFIEGIYLALFKRYITKDEKIFWMDLLKNSSISKNEIILKLYFTKERYQCKTKVSGIYKLAFISLFGKFK